MLKINGGNKSLLIYCISFIKKKHSVLKHDLFTTDFRGEKNVSCLPRKSVKNQLHFDQKKEECYFTLVFYYLFSHSYFPELIF